MSERVPIWFWWAMVSWISIMIALVLCHIGNRIRGQEPGQNPKTLPPHPAADKCYREARIFADFAMAMLAIAIWLFLRTS